MKSARASGRRSRRATAGGERPDVALDSLSTADLGAGRLDGLTHALKAGVSRGWRPVVLPIVTAALALAAWEALVRVRRIPSAILPPPTEGAQTLVSVCGWFSAHT